MKLADEAVCIGTALASDSYLRMDRIIEAIKQTGAQVRQMTGFCDGMIHYMQLDLVKLFGTCK